MTSGLFDGFKGDWTSSFDSYGLYFENNFQNCDKNLPTLMFHYGLVCSNSHWDFQIPFFSSNGLSYYHP